MSLLSMIKVMLLMMAISLGGAVSIISRMRRPGKGQDETLGISKKVVSQARVDTDAPRARKLPTIYLNDVKMDFTNSDNPNIVQVAPTVEDATISKVAPMVQDATIPMTNDFNILNVDQLTNHVNILKVDQLTNDFNIPKVDHACVVDEDKLNPQQKDLFGQDIKFKKLLTDKCNKAYPPSCDESGGSPIKYCTSPDPDKRMDQAPNEGSGMMLQQEETNTEKLGYLGRYIVQSRPSFIDEGLAMMVMELEDDDGNRIFDEATLWKLLALTVFKAFFKEIVNFISPIFSGEFIQLGENTDYWAQVKAILHSVIPLLSQKSLESLNGYVLTNVQEKAKYMLKKKAVNAFLQMPAEYKLEEGSVESRFSQIPTAVNQLIGMVTKSLDKATKITNYVAEFTKAMRTGVQFYEAVKAMYMILTTQSISEILKRAPYKQILLPFFMNWITKGWNRILDWLFSSSPNAQRPFPGASADPVFKRFLGNIDHTVKANQELDWQFQWEQVLKNEMLEKLRYNFNTQATTLRQTFRATLSDILNRLTGNLRQAILTDDRFGPSGKEVDCSVPNAVKEVTNSAGKVQRVFTNWCKPEDTTGAQAVAAYKQILNDHEIEQQRCGGALKVMEGKFQKITLGHKNVVEFAHVAQPRIVVPPAKIQPWETACIKAYNKTLNKLSNVEKVTFWFQWYKNTTGTDSTENNDDRQLRGLWHGVVKEDAPHTYLDGKWNLKKANIPGDKGQSIQITNDKFCWKNGQTWCYKFKWDDTSKQMHFLIDKDYKMIPNQMEEGYFPQTVDIEFQTSEGNEKNKFQTPEEWKEKLDQCRAPDSSKNCELTLKTPVNNKWGTMTPIGQDATFKLQLKNITLVAGQTTALIGGSGSGKSTILGLLTKLYHKLNGDILFHTDQRSYDITEVNLLAWNAAGRIRYLAQANVPKGDIANKKVSSVILNGHTQHPEYFIPKTDKWGPFDYVSVEEQQKIRIEQLAHNKEIEEKQKKDEKEKLMKVFKLAKLENTDTNFKDKEGISGGAILDQSYTAISGGQLRRVLLANVLYDLPEEPCMILLDEPTTGLDAKSVIAIEQTMKELAENGHMVLVITHDVPVIAVDQILYVKQEVDGVTRIVEKGTHDELMRLENNYFLDVLRKWKTNKEEYKLKQQKEDAIKAIKEMLQQKFGEEGIKTDSLAMEIKEFVNGKEKEIERLESLLETMDAEMKRLNYEFEELKAPM